MTKLGLHVNKVTNLLVPFVRDTKPRIIKFLDHDVGTIKACHDASPNSILIGRLFVVDQSSDQPQKNAQTLVDKILPVADRLRDYYLAWESYNEENPPTADGAKRFGDFHVHFGELMHAHGLKTVAYNFSTGAPPLEFWQYYQDGAAASDYIGLHEYDAPTMDRLHRESLAKGENGMYLCLRYRRVWDLLRPDARKPFIITECGIDGGVIDEYFRDEDGKRVKKSGYKHFRPQHTAADYMDGLAWYDDELNRDDFVVGATVFCFGQERALWEPFDIANDDEAREAFQRLLQQRSAPPRPVSTSGEFVHIAKDGQPSLGGAGPQPQPVSKPEPSPQPVTPPQTQPCARPAAPWFSGRFAFDKDLQRALGCPADDEHSTFFAEQPFEHGLMLYRADTRQIYALLQDGTYRALADTWSEGQPEGGFVTPPPNRLEPRRGFGKVWREQLGGATAKIGFATAAEQGLSGQVQDFEQGLALHDARGIVRVLLNNSRYIEG